MEATEECWQRPRVAQASLQTCFRVNAKMKTSRSSLYDLQARRTSLDQPQMSTSWWARSLVSHRCREYLLCSAQHKALLPFLACKQDIAGLSGNHRSPLPACRDMQLQGSWLRAFILACMLARTSLEMHRMKGEAILICGLPYTILEQSRKHLLPRKSKWSSTPAGSVSSLSTWTPAWRLRGSP